MEKLHPYVAPLKNKFQLQITQRPVKTNSRYRNTRSPVQNCLHPPVKIRNKFQSQNNHDSFNCRPSKSNPHSINQKSVIFSVHKNTSSECLKHKCHIAPTTWPLASYTFTPPFDVATRPIPRHHNVHRSEDMD